MLSLYFSRRDLAERGDRILPGFSLGLHALFISLGQIRSLGQIWPREATRYGRGFLSASMLPLSGGLMKKELATKYCFPRRSSSSNASRSICTPEIYPNRWAMETHEDADNEMMLPTTMPQNMQIDPRSARFPCCIVWTPLPVLSWFIPFIGHIGICREDGVILDFAGPNFVCVDNFAFGSVARYFQINKVNYETLFMIKVA
ncbi:hypothetical protein Scep_000598 [Stephania cephalantha]|uniref:Uncharacterized protein n=1 Tax=Stephania cephalantha TaxID=152367 RepID=A0AAP0L7X9_9MAGN